MNQNNELYYLALPYQGTEQQKAYRTELSLTITSSFLKQGIYLFAPILYVNRIADSLSLESLEERRKIIMPYLFEFLRVSKGMILITVEGWASSWGVQQEIDFCEANQIPVFQMEPEEISGDLKAVISNSLTRDGLLDLLDVVEG